jgi:hypothetical protein
MILKWIMLRISRIELPIISFVNAILVCFCCSWTFGSFHPTCGECCRAYILLFPCSLQRNINQYLPVDYLLCKLRLLLASVSPQKPRLKSEFVCVGVSMRLVPSPGTSIYPCLLSVHRCSIFIYPPKLLQNIHTEFTRIAHLQAYDNFFVPRCFVS